MKRFFSLRRRRSAPAKAPAGTGAPLPAFDEGRYRVGFARNAGELRAAQRLRFEVFNVELGEGLATSWENGRDEDRFDEVCDHLLVSERTTGRLVGTYRMQTASMARERSGWYCDGEFHVDDLTASVLERSAELGRACIVPDARNGTVLFALWRGLAAYAEHRGARYYFGCCSLTSQDPNVGWRVHRFLEAKGHLAQDQCVRVRDTHACVAAPGDGKIAEGVPTLFRTYLRFGAKVLSAPALDREFQTIDYLVLLDLQRISPRVRGLFFGGLGA